MPKLRFCFTALLIVFAAVACGRSDETGADYVGEPPANMEIPLASEFDRDSYRGKAVLLNFWATWCGPCKIEIPALIKLRKSFKPEDVAIVGISTGEYGAQPKVQRQLKEFAADFDINYELYYDHDNSLFTEWARRESLMGALPSTLLFDASGELRGKHLGVPHDRRTGKIDPFGVLGEEIEAIIDGR